MDLRAARAIVPYLARLGISHVYVSPLLQARRESRHGYDVVDPTRLDPKLGTEADLRALVRTLRRHAMGLVLDLVPNHGDRPREPTGTTSSRTEASRWARGSTSRGERQRAARAAPHPDPR
jgi:1,4-alpha-glucan branching enzyme